MFPLTFRTPETSESVSSFKKWQSRRSIDVSSLIDCSQQYKLKLQHSKTRVTKTVKLGFLCSSCLLVKTLKSILITIPNTNILPNQQSDNNR